MKPGPLLGEAGLGKKFQEDDKTYRISNTLDGTERDDINTNEMPELADDEMALDNKFGTNSKEEDK